MVSQVSAPGAAHGTGNTCRRDTRAEAIVHVDDRNARCTAVQHRKQRGQAIETPAIAHTRRHRYQRCSDQSAYDRGQRSFHARNGDHRIRSRDALTLRQQPMQAGDTDIHDDIRASTEDPHRLCALADHRQVRGTRGNYGDYAARARHWPQDGGPADLIDNRAGKLREACFDGVSGQPGSQHSPARMCFMERTQRHHHL